LILLTQKLEEKSKLSPIYIPCVQQVGIRGSRREVTISSRFLNVLDPDTSKYFTGDNKPVK
jgi:hypothetical protein